MLITESGKKKLETSLAGKVSYLRGNTETNPQKIDMGNPLLEEQGKSSRSGTTTNVVYCEMSDYQYGVYQRALHLDLNKDFDVDLTSAIKNIESDHDVWMFEEDFDNLKNGFFIGCRPNCVHVFIDEDRQEAILNNFTYFTNFTIYKKNPIKMAIKIIKKK